MTTPSDNLLTRIRSIEGEPIKVATSSPKSFNSARKLGQAFRSMFAADSPSERGIHEAKRLAAIRRDVAINL